MAKKVTGYQADDGTFFQHQHDAELHDAELAFMQRWQVSLHSPGSVGVSSFIEYMKKEQQVCYNLVMAIHRAMPKEAEAAAAPDDLEEQRKGKTYGGKTSRSEQRDLQPDKSKAQNEEHAGSSGAGRDKPVDPDTEVS